MSDRSVGDALVLGASGFLGQAVAGRLALEGWRLRVLVHKRMPEGMPSNLRVVQASLGDVPFAGDEVVFHCARLRGNGMWGRRFAAWRGKRANGKIVQRLGPTPLVYASGSLMYGDCGDAPVFEDSPLRPTSYAREYAIAEQPFLNTPVIMFRPGWILGPGSWLEWFYLQPAEQTGAIPLYGSGGNLMSIVHREDCARAMIHVARHGKAGVCHPPPSAVVTQRQFVEQLASELRLPIRELPLRGKERAVREAFECSINLQSRHAGLWTNFVPRFRDLRTALQNVIAARKARIRQSAMRA